MCSKSLCNFTGGVVFESESSSLGFFSSGFVLRFVCITTLPVSAISISSIQCPKPHGSETRIFLKAGSVRALEDQSKRFLGNSRPDLLQVFFKRHSLATGFFNLGVTGEYF